MKGEKVTYVFKFPRMHIFAECDEDSDPEPEDYDTVKALPSKKVMVLPLHNHLNSSVNF